MSSSELFSSGKSPAEGASDSPKSMPADPKCDSIPSKIVLLTKSQYNDIALEASSLPGIGKSTPSVEELESSIATTGIPIFFASFIAIASLFVSTTKSMSGMFFISLIPPRDRFNFWCSFSILSLSFFVKRESWLSSKASRSFNLKIEFDTVFQFVKVPPSHL